MRRDVIVRLFVESFMDDPYFEWICRDVTIRRTLLLSVFEAAVAAADHQGYLHQRGENAAIIVLPPGKPLYDPRTSASIGNLYYECSDQEPELLDDYFQQVEENVPSELCWYLFYLATHTPSRRRGFASSLIEDVLQLSRESGNPVFLHTARVELLPFYKSFGFEAVASIACIDGPQLFCLMASP